MYITYTYIHMYILSSRQTQKYRKITKKSCSIRSKMSYVDVAIGVKWLLCKS